MNAWTPGVNTLYRNVSVLAAALGPRSWALRLGLSWGFGLPVADCPGPGSGLVEYSFGLEPDGDVPTRLRERGGLGINAHPDPAGTAMAEHLRATGDPVIVVVDSGLLPYRPAFGRVHSQRTIVIEALVGDEAQVDDHWEPVYRGPVSQEDLCRSRSSSVREDPLLEPIFSGVRAPAEWFTVTMEPLAVDDPDSWAAGTIATLVADMIEPASPRTDEVIFGLAGMRSMVDRLAVLGDDAGAGISRRTLALVLRAELSRRHHLCLALRNLLNLVGRTDLVPAVNRYQSDLKHLQAIRDVLVKTLRRERSEYDEYLRARGWDALAAEERLLTLLIQAFGPTSVLTPSGVDVPTGAATSAREERSDV